MKNENNPFGYTKIGKFNNGDLVQWKTWAIIDKKVHSIVNYGTILNIYNEKHGARNVCMAKILCSKTTNILSISLLRLDKEETT